MGNTLKKWTLVNQDLPAMNVDPNTIVVGGYSCGSAMTSNLVIIGSDTIKGAVMMNGYYMYGGYAVDGDTDTDAKVQTKVDFINSQYADGKIDNPSNLNDVPVYVFRGVDDYFEQKPQADVFKKLNTDTSNVLYEVDPNGGHYFGKEQVDNALNHIYGKMDSSFTQLNAVSEKWAEEGTLLKIDQSDFIDYEKWGSPGIRTRGWLYYPDTCATNQCKLLVWLHGGGGTGVYRLEELGPIAAANDMILLFPEGDKEGQTNCWEGQYPGYTDTDSWSHNGVQQKAILDMIKQLKEPSDSALLQDLKQDSWSMPLGWLDMNGFFEEKWGIQKLPQAYRNAINSEWFQQNMA